MKSPILTLTTLDSGTRAPGAKRILAAFEDATNKSETAVQAMLLCGQIMREQRTALLLEGGPRNNQHTPDEAQFGKWLARECPKICERTAQRWMKAAERVDNVLQLSGCIDIEATPLSEMLSATTANKAQQLWLDFTADKTFADCLRDVMDGESPDHRLARVHNGKKAAGAGGSGDRKQFERFSAIKLQHLTTFLRAKLTTNQKGLIVATFNNALEAWPRWLIEALAEKAKGEAKLTDQERVSRKLF